MKNVLFAIFSLFMFSCSSANEQPKIASLHYEAGPCFGFCPMFSMDIDADGTIIYEAIRYTSSRSEPEKGSGRFKGRLNPAQQAQLQAAISSLNLQNLKSFYGDKGITDLPTSKLRLSMQNGKTAATEDYGQRGTPQLINLYQLLNQFRNEVSWTAVSP